MACGGCGGKIALFPSRKGNVLGGCVACIATAALGCLVSWTFYLSFLLIAPDVVATRVLLAMALLCTGLLMAHGAAALLARIRRTAESETK